MAGVPVPGVAGGVKAGLSSEGGTAPGVEGPVVWSGWGVSSRRERWEIALMGPSGAGA
jgi:hypothetical protein